MSDRRWQAGDDFWCNGIRYRVVEGRKKEGDLRLEQRVDGEWQPVKMEAGLMLADFFFDNEQVLYPREKGFHGGHEYLRAMQDAALRGGWEAAQRKLREQQMRIRRGARAAIVQCFPGRNEEDGTTR